MKKNYVLYDYGSDEHFYLCLSDEQARVIRYLINDICLLDGTFTESESKVFEEI